MIFRRLTLPIAATAVLLCGTAAAQTWTGIAQRERLLDDRIDAGVRTGQLTPPEAARLRSEYRTVVDLERRYSANGLSRTERADLDHRFDNLQRQVRLERRDDQTGGWFGGRGWTDKSGRWTPVKARQQELERRIERGVRDGRLTTAEAAHLRTEYRRIAEVEQRYRRHGLTGSERADLDRRFDGLAAQIRWEATDSQLRYGYGRSR